MRDLNIFIPYSINYILLENKLNSSMYIYLYNITYYCCLNFKNKIYINNDSNNIIVNNNFYNNNFSTSSTELNRFLFTWSGIFFKKVKFSGKGFKFRKKQENLFLFFNRAHKCFFIGSNIILLRLSKNKVLLLRNNLYSIIHDTNIIKEIRPNNIFTKRGLRTSRQIIFKKRGKTATH